MYLTRFFPGIGGLIITLSLCLPVFASTNHDGASIMEEVDRRDEGFGDFSASVVMVLKDQDGERATRYFHVNNLEVPNDGDKRLLVFDRPADISKTALLTYSHSLENDEQWLFLPALKRVKRIASSNKSGPFVGSEFAYEDLSSQEYEKYGDYRLLGEELVNGVESYKIERKPLYDHSGYRKQIVWIDKAHYRYQKIHYYDKVGRFLKELVLSKYELYLNKYWRPNFMEMTNQQSGKSTTMSWNDIVFQTGVNNSDFTRTSLKRAR